MVKEGKAIYKAVEIVYVPVLDPKIINNKTEGNLRRDMAKERGGGCLVVTVLGEMGHELLISMKPGLGKAGDSIDNLSIITLDKRRNAEVVQKSWPVI
jgi:hypothetical protein